MHSRIRNELKYLRRWVEILDSVIASLQDFAAGQRKSEPGRPRIASI